MHAKVDVKQAGSDEKAKVADAVARTAANYGARFAFGIPGNDVLETVRACEDAGIHFYLAKSEPSAAFMADAVYQLTGKPAVLIPALGPGISNAISGIAGAMQERTAMLVLSGEMGTPNQGIYNHQVFDHVALARPVTKYAELLNPKRAAQQTAKALDIAMAYPAGPVMLNVPADANRASATAQEDYMPPRETSAVLSPGSVADARAMLSAAKRPLALIGRGALMGEGPTAVNRFVSTRGMPFFTTYKAKGIINERDALCMGSVGLSPVVDAENMKLVAAADLVVLIGFDPIELRDAWLDAWPHTKPVLSIDWTAATHRIFPLGLQAVGDVPSILAQLAPVPGVTSAAWEAAPLATLKQAVANIVRARSPAQGISPAALFAEVDRQSTPEWVMTVDVGSHRILANHVIRCHVPGQLMQSNGLGCMGYAVPAANAAQLVHADRPVVALLGDGCMLMTQGELAIAAELELPIVVVVLNDSSLSLIKLKQSKMGMGARATDFKSPRFDVIAQGFGAHGVRVDSQAGFAKALAEAIAGRRFTVIDAIVDPAEYWEQM
jgi:acetolactate synthase-1/2/3 large subunit